MCGCCDSVRRKIRRLQKIEANWITNIQRYADLLDKYSQVLSDSTGFLWITSTEEKLQSIDEPLGRWVNFLKEDSCTVVVEFSSSMPNHSHIWNEM